MDANAAGPHHSALARTVRTGGFFLPGDLQDSATGAWQLGPAWVQWEAPASGTNKCPFVFVHGGGGQSTDWFGVADDVPGWAPQAVEQGFPAYLLDRPGHGRSPYDPARLGARTGFPDYAGAAAVFVPEGGSTTAGSAKGGSPTQGSTTAGSTTAVNAAWPWGRAPGSAELDALVASSSGMLTDTALSQELDARRITDLLERTGPAVLVTHSAGAAGGWLAAARARHNVRAVVAVEPIGPPYRSLGPRGRLDYGVTAVPLAPSTSDAAPPSGTCAPLGGVPVLVVSGDSSGRADNDAETVAFLDQAGALASHLRLESLGIRGNGHGLVFEANTKDVFAPVLQWLAGLNIS
ncbi:alpha/beta fold hydrolase [Arthrobacter sp. USHLN218]|uniref:alpha/beta fold hydrolase n=1 Tax=Arthrobacter sp. USHLN218 TaxID=3081232 RepID=UPI003016E03C